jgi:hypothetical protein
MHQRDQMAQPLFDDEPPRRTSARWAVILVTVSVVFALAVARSREPPLVSAEAQLSRQLHPSVTPLEAIEPPPLDRLIEVVIPDTGDGSGSAHPDQDVASPPPPQPDAEEPAPPEPPKPVQLSPDDEKAQLFKEFLQTLRPR